jgi:hypothetical protein
MTTTETACYQLVYSNGEPVDTGDCIPHFLTLEEAVESAARYKVDRLGTPKPEQLSVPCVDISCSDCGYVLDEDDAMNYHFQPDEIEDSLQAWEWKVDGDKHLCPECISSKASV